MYFNSDDSTPNTEETDIPYFNLTGVNSSLTYFFKVQAKNKWGSSNYSALVESPPDRDDITLSPDRDDITLSSPLPTTLCTDCDNSKLLLIL